MQNGVTTTTPIIPDHYNCTLTEADTLLALAAQLMDCNEPLLFKESADRKAVFHFMQTLRPYLSSVFINSKDIKDFLNNIKNLNHNHFWAGMIVESLHGTILNMFDMRIQCSWQLFHKSLQALFDQYKSDIDPSTVTVQTIEKFQLPKSISCKFFFDFMGQLDKISPLSCQVIHQYLFLIKKTISKGQFNGMTAAQLAMIAGSSLLHACNLNKQLSSGNPILEYAFMAKIAIILLECSAFDCEYDKTDYSQCMQAAYHNKYLECKTHLDLLYSSKKEKKEKKEKKKKNTLLDLNEEVVYPVNKEPFKLSQYFNQMTIEEKSVTTTKSPSTKKSLTVPTLLLFSERLKNIDPLSNQMQSIYITRSTSSTSSPELVTPPSDESDKKESSSNSNNSNNANSGSSIKNNNF